MVRNERNDSEEEQKRWEEHVLSCYKFEPEQKYLPEEIILLLSSICFLFLNYNQMASVLGDKLLIRLVNEGGELKTGDKE